MYSHSHFASVRRGSLHTPSPAEVGGVRLPVMVAVHKVDGRFDPGKILVGQDHVVEGRQFVGHVAAQDHEFGRRGIDLPAKLRKILRRSGRADMKIQHKGKAVRPGEVFGRPYMGVFRDMHGVFIAVKKERKAGNHAERACQDQPAGTSARLPVGARPKPADRVFRDARGGVAEERGIGGRKQIPVTVCNGAVYGDEQQRRAGDQDQLEKKDQHARGGELSFAQRDLYGKDKGKKYEDLQDHLFTSCIGSRSEFFPI